MMWLRRRRTPAADPAPDRVADAASPVPDDVLDAATRHGWRALDRLIDQLVNIDENGAEGSARETLHRLAARPRLLARLDEHARRHIWWSADYSPVIDRARKRLQDGTAGPISIALASTHTDGHVREAALIRMLTAPDPDWMPFVVLRSADWVKPVRERARVGLVLLLDEDPETYLPAMLGMALLVADRGRGGFAQAQALAALLRAAPSLRDHMYATGDRDQRRFVVDTGLSQGWWRLPTLVALLEAERGDARTRARVAEAACRQALWTRQVQTLRRLAGNRQADVRALAVTALVRAGRDTDAAAHLNDPATLVRAIAADTARRIGLDPRQHYRRAVMADNPAPGAIAGLAEVGGDADAALLRDLLTHPSAPTRAQAVRALGQLGPVPADVVTPMLHDPSPAVVRAATAALLQARAVHTDLAWRLIADPRAEVRRAGYRLLRSGPIADQVRAAQLLANDPDPRLSRRAVADATRLVRSTSQQTGPPEGL